MPWSKQMRLESAAFVVFRPCMSVLNNILMTVFLKDFVSLLRNVCVERGEWEAPHCHTSISRRFRK